MKKFAAIFDMDGTLIDNNKYHFEAFKQLFKDHGLPELTQKLFDDKLSGTPGIGAIKEVFGSKTNDDEAKALYKEKTDNYMKLYAPHICPIDGLERFLGELKDAGIKIALATSAPRANIDFVFSHIKLNNYFDTMIDNTQVTKGKPDPQVFLKAAESLRMEPADCVVFEDSLAGVKAANSAGMKVVGITTTEHNGQLKPVNFLIDDYTNISVEKLAALFN